MSSNYSADEIEVFEGLEAIREIQLTYLHAFRKNLGLPNFS